MKNIYIRKYVLLASCLVLFAVYIALVFTKGKNNVKNLEVQDIDRIELSSQGKEIIFEMKNGEWKTGEKLYKAESSKISSIEAALKSLKLLGKASLSLTEANAERYGLNEEAKITAKAFFEGKIVRTLEIGKNTSAGGQAYVMIDDKDTVYIASGALNTTFSLDEKDARSKDLWSLESSKVNAISSRVDGEVFDLVFESSAVDPSSLEKSSWKIVENKKEMEADESKIQTFINDISKIRVQEWLEEGSPIPRSIPYVKMTVYQGVDSYTISVFGDENDEDFTGFIEGGDSFILSKYQVQKLAKKVSSFVK